MESSIVNGICPRCGYKPGMWKEKNHQLAPLNILQGRYLLGRVLGEGGFGITYIALDLKTKQRVAIKELFVSQLSRREHGSTVIIGDYAANKTYYEECMRKFRMEAEILKKLENTSGIVRILDHFPENNTAYLVMEYLDGDELILYLKKRGGKIPVKEAFSMLRAPMKSMIELHRMGVYHRDISPENIQYLKNGSVKIMDLGGAKNVSRGGPQTSMVMVKHGYAPPEQYTIGYKIGAWMDVYAMAATLYRCITGQIPASAPSRIQNPEKLKSPLQLGVDISPELNDVIMRGLEMNVEKRYLDMREFYTALKQAGATSVQNGYEKPGVISGKQNGDPEYDRLLESFDEEDDKARLVMLGWICGIVGVFLTIVLVILFVI